VSARAYTVASLAREWECSESVIRKLVATEQLRCFRVGTLIRIPVAEVERYECQATACNDSEAVTPSSTATNPATATDTGYSPPTGLALRRRLGKAGPSGEVRRGPWAGS
jgi:excisionase family DNA binding protein